MKFKHNNLGIDGKKRVENMIAYTIIFIAIFAFVIIVVDTLVTRFG